MTYAEWIAAYEARTPILLGRCQAAVDEMVLAFPELKPVPGHVWVPGEGRRTHWWCTTEDARIIDPTMKQFPAVLGYEPWEPGEEVRVGKCMECGEELWDAAYSLSEPPPHRFFCRADPETGADCMKAFSDAQEERDEERNQVGLEEGCSSDLLET